MQVNQLRKSQSRKENPQANSSLKTDRMYGNKDDKKRLEFETKFADHYLVRHFRFEKLSSGSVVEDPGSSRYQFYDEETFDNLSNQAVKDGKQMPSKFQIQGLEVEVLHDPTIIN